VTIQLVQRPGELEIVVEDDGGGPASPGPPNGQGLRGMHERCRLLGGDVAVGPRPGGGFRVCARLPLQSDNAIEALEPKVVL
jgi:signal transduction histidine kinase